MYLEIPLLAVLFYQSKDVAKRNFLENLHSTKILEVEKNYVHNCSKIIFNS